MNTLSRLETVAGDYGLYIKIKYTDEIDTTALQEKTFNFSQNDMYGDVYNFTTYFSQEAVFDISGLGNITNIDAFLYQNSNFKKIKSTADGNDDYELIPSKIIEKNQNGEIVYIEEMEPNIFVDNIKISLGYDLNNFDNDTVIVYTLDSAQYSSSDNAKAREREIQARWVHKTDDGFISVLEQDLANYNAQIHWYHYQLDEKAKQDEFGGKYWVPIKDYSGKQYLDKNDDYKCYIECDPAVQDENVKAVISLPSSERNEYLQEVSATLNKGDLISVDQIEILLKELNEAPNKLTNDDILEALNDLITKYTELENPTENEQKCLEYLNKINEEISGLPCIDLYSDIVQIHNTTQVQARLAVDLVQAVSISVGDEKDSYKGVYMIYGENGEIMNSSISAQRQKLILSYGSLLTGLKEFDGNGSELVSWRFPLTNTMIRMPVEGIEYINENIEYNGESIPSIQYRNDAGEITEAENATWAIINRVIEKTDGEDKIIKIGDFDLKTTEQIFRIKDYYTSVGRNTIYCEIQKGGYVYVAEITLIFGVAGTSGTDYTLRIVQSATALQEEINLTAHVYDYNNQEVEITSVEYSFISPDSLNADLKIVPSDFPVKLINQVGTTITATFQAHNINNYYIIIKAVARIEALDTALATIFPLSWSKNLKKYNYFEGPDKIIYSAQGSNPFYYKNTFVLYDIADQPVDGISWALEVYDENLDKAQKFYPSVFSNNNLYSLKVPSMYIKENHLCRLIGKIDNDIIWVQPLYIAQNAYNSPLLNKWDETVSIDEEGGTIMAPMIGAGKKNTNNQFSGVLMGDVKKANNDISLTGLYGYQNGIQTFSLTENGKANFGASGSGQIQIDGNQGIIESGNYTVDKKTGMQIDLKEGHIDAYNFKLTSNYVTIDSTEKATNYFTIKGTGDVDTITYEYNYNNLKDTLTTTITSSTVTKTLFNVGNSSYYLQTLDYNSVNNQEAGMRWDLASGKLRAYGGFNLEAINHKVKVNSTGGDAEQLNYPPIYVEIKAQDGSAGYNSSSDYIYDRVKIHNYRQYYFQLNGDTTYYNNWEIFETAPFQYTYEVIKDSDGNYCRTVDNYTGIFDQYYFGYKDNTDKEPWSGDENIELVTNYKKITKDNWKANTPYFRVENIIGLDTTVKSTTGKFIFSLWKKVDTKKYTLIGCSGDKNLNVGIVTGGNNLYKLSQNPNRKDTIDFIISQDGSGNTKYIECWYFDYESNKLVKSSNVSYNKDDNSLNIETTNIPEGTIPEIYTTAGLYYKGTLAINADAGQYPLQLKLGEETPFKLSWAGYLFTTKLQATGGAIGGWHIDTNGLWSSNSSPKIQINKTGTISLSIPDNDGFSQITSNKTYTGPHILVGGRSGKFIDKVYNSIGSGELTEHTEGNFSNEDIGKYIQKNGSYYKIMRITLNDTGSYYEQVYSGEGGIALTGDGTIAIENLYLKGGGGYWGGCAAYSTATTSTGHTHKISGTIKTATMCNTLWMRKLDGTVADDGSMKAYFVENYSVTCCYSGNTNSGITATYNGTTVTPNAGDSYATYYTSDAYTKMKKAYETAKDNYDTATRKYYHAQDFKFGLTTKTIYAYRTGDRRVVLTDSYPGGIWVD